MYLKITNLILKRGKRGEGRARGGLGDGSEGRGGGEGSEVGRDQGGRCCGDDGHIHGDDDQHRNKIPFSTIFDNRARWPQTYTVDVYNGAAIVCLETKLPMTSNPRFRLLTMKYMTNEC